MLSIKNILMVSMFVILLSLVAISTGCSENAMSSNIENKDSGNKDMNNKVEKSEEEWKKELGEASFCITRLKGTERAFSGKYYKHYEEGVYVCVACGQELFKSDTKYDSGSGWPSFFQPVSEDAIKYEKDTSHGMVRTEIMCSRCDAHLGHVFDDGPKPTGQRYCVNSLSLNFIPADKKSKAEDKVKDIETITLGAGCFWCTEAVYKSLDGVESVTVGYMGGDTKNPTYKQVVAGGTGHIEVAQIKYDKNKLPLEKILEVFWKVHDPTSMDRQGADTGVQYRSVIFYSTSEQKKIAEKSIKELGVKLVDPVVTKLLPAKEFWKAEDYHQDYYENNKDAPYCRAVIAPKLKKIEDYKKK